MLWYQAVLSPENFPSGVADFGAEACLVLLTKLTFVAKVLCAEEQQHRWI